MQPYDTAHGARLNKNAFTFKPLKSNLYNQPARLARGYLDARDRGGDIHVSGEQGHAELKRRRRRRALITFCKRLRGCGGGGDWILHFARTLQSEANTILSSSEKYPQNVPPHKQKLTLPESNSHF